MSMTFWRRQVFEYHPVIGWWHLPNLRARVPLGGTYHTVETNAMGMRSSRDYAVENPAGRKRIVFLGDSYTAGDGVGNKLRFTDLLEKRFPHLDALNFGLNGSGTDQQILIHENFAAPYKPHAYVFCICVENIARNMYDCFPSFDWREQQVAYRPKPYFELQANGLALKNVPVPHERRTADELGDWRSSFPYMPGDPDPYAIYKDPQSAHWKTMKAILQRFIDSVSGTPVLIVPLPMYQHYLEEVGPTYLPRFQELSSPEKDIHIVDLLPAMRLGPMQKRLGYRFPDDPHYTAAAHQLVADALEYELLTKVPTSLR